MRLALVRLATVRLALVLACAALPRGLTAQAGADSAQAVEAQRAARAALAAANAAAKGDPARTTFAAELAIDLSNMRKAAAGVYTRDVEEGAGVPAMPGREVLVTYLAYLADGTLVDRTAADGRPLAFTVGAGTVIRGWDVGVRGMRTGGTRVLVVPSRAAYGARGNDKVPPDAVMVFVMRLEGVR